MTYGCGQPSTLLLHRILIGEDQPFVEYVADVIRNYGSSVQHGHRHIYQSVPRLLTVWFEFGTHCVGITGKPTKQVDIDAAQRSPPAFQIASCFSRFVHRRA